MLESEHVRKVGRPTPKDDLLMSRRDRLVWLLSVAWGDIGWQLPKAVSCEQLHEALAPLRGHPSEDAISIFIRRTSASTTSQELRKLRKELEKTIDRMYAAYQKQRIFADSLREADAAIKVNRVEDADTELKLDPRLDEKQRNAMVSEFKKREAKLRSGDIEVTETCNLERDLRTELQDRDAAFAQAELLDYITKKQYARNPLGLGNAMAGLPELGWSQSYARCSKIKCAGWPSLWFTVFKTIQNIWKDRMSELSTVELFRREIQKLPRKTLVDYEPESKKVWMPNQVRLQLADNFMYLRLAIEETLKTKMHPGRIPFAITALFEKNIGKTRTAADSLLIAHERIE